MRLTRQHRQPGRPELNMASMIDIVFLLLIFFMCTSSFTKQESEMPTQMPQAGTGKKQDQQDFGPIRIHLSWDGTGVLVECDGKACGGYVGLLRQLKALRAISPDRPVLIEGGPRVPFGHMVAALDTTYGAEFTTVAFSAKGVSR